MTSARVAGNRVFLGIDRSGPSECAGAAQAGRDLVVAAVAVAFAQRVAPAARVGRATAAVIDAAVVGGRQGRALAELDDTHASA